MALSEERLAERLAADGVVVVEDYWDADRCDAVRERVERALDEGMAEAAPDDDYGDLAARDEPVVNRRTGTWDDGMLDVFNMDLAVDDLAAFKQDDRVRAAIDGATDRSYTPDNVNVYVNREVNPTRDYHADTYGGKFKSFVYLTDVPDESYGPFAYIPGTHDASVLTRKASTLLNRARDDPPTDAVFYDESEAVVCTAPKGTLVVANQAGYHRGFPQAEGRERMLATTSYTPA
jgi:hypothetical protein